MEERLTIRRASSDPLPSMTVQCCSSFHQFCRRLQHCEAPVALRALLSGILISSIVLAAVYWKDFNCPDPVQLWLVLHQSLILAILLVHQLLDALRGSPSPNTRRLMFLSAMTSRDSWQLRLVCHLEVVFLAPCFVCSLITGLVIVLGRESVRFGEVPCWPDDVTWINAAAVVSGSLCIESIWAFAILLDYFQLVARGVRRCCIAFRRRWRVSGATWQDLDHGPARSVQASLRGTLHYCPEATCDMECTAYCSICQDACLEGQRLRTVIACGHQYHSECLETWLRQRQTCPNCGQDVATPVAT